MREKETELEKAEHERLIEIKRKEEEEVRKLRSQMIFKASKIRNFRFKVPEEVCKPKSLTVPQPPKLHTHERA